MEFIDDRLRRKLIKRRGQLHAFERIDPSRTAVVVIDVTQSVLDNMPPGTSIVDPINALTAAARAAGTQVAWIAPLPPSRSNAPTVVARLFGAEAMRRQEIELAGDRSPARGLFVVEVDWHLDKRSYSAFFPGNSALPDRLAARGIDTVIIAGLLTDICIASSARDAFECGYRVLVCADGVAANEPMLHAMALRTLARGYADVRTSGELAALLAAGAERG